MSLEIESLKRMLHEEVDQLENMDVRKRLQYLMVCSAPEKREQLQERFVEVVSRYLKEHGIEAPQATDLNQDGRLESHLQALREDGITRLGPVLSPQQIDEIHRHLGSCPVHGGGTVNAGAEGGWEPVAEAKKKHRECSYKMEDLIDAPHLLELMASPWVVDLTTRYLGAPPSIFSPNLFWSFSNVPGVSPSQEIHRDWDGFRHLALFIYLVDVKQENGAHQYLRKSHSLKSIEKVLSRAKGKKDLPSKSELFYYQFDQKSPGNERLLSLFAEEEVSVEGRAGEAFLVDPFGLHRGHPLIKDERLLFWARYSLYHNGNSIDVSRRPVPAETVRHRIPNDRLHKYMFRTCIESDFSQVAESTLHLPSALLMDPPARVSQFQKPSRRKLIRNFFSSS